MEPEPGTRDAASVVPDAHDTHRATVWLPLMRRLTDEVPGWVVIKNADAALDGIGDVDSMAAARDWRSIEAIFRSWASDQGLTTLGVCRHIWRGPNFVARDPASRYLLALDVKMLRTFRGSPLVTVDDALALADLDARGFRRIRPGAEAVIKLLHNGTSWSGGLSGAGLERKGVPALLQSDPIGADLAAAWVGPAASALRRAIDAVIAGSWSRADMLVVEAWCLARGVVHPADPVRQLWLRAFGERCPFVRLTRRDQRRMPLDSEAWVMQMRLAHPEPALHATLSGVAS